MIHRKTQQGTEIRERDQRFYKTSVFLCDFCGLKID